MTDAAAVTMDDTAQKRRLEAFITRDYTIGKDSRTEWTKVGIAFEHASKHGFTLHITPGLAVSGDVVLRDPRDKETADKDA